MPTDAWAQGLARYAKQWWPEALLVVLVLAAFLGCLGSVELWGKREQRAAAEAIDTVDHNHWLVAEIQGRPRLEKPPLPRWSIADAHEAHRPPRRMDGPASRCGRRRADGCLDLRAGTADERPRAGPGLVLRPLFDGVLRRRDAPGQQRRSARALHHAGPLRGLAPARGDAGNPTRPSRCHFRLGGSWSFYAALGLGFLTKGPIILLLVAVTLIPYLAFQRRLWWGLRRLASAAGGC